MTRQALFFAHRLLTIALLLTLNVSSVAKGIVYSPRINTLQVVAGDDFLSPAVIELDGDRQITVSFDEMSHDNHRLTYHIEHCNPDWTTSDELLESDYLEGFNDIVIDDYDNSVNTTVLYTHYKFSIPNDRCQLKLSGNYRITVCDDDTGEHLLEARFRIVDPKTDLTMSISGNTDIDVNKSHQQLSMAISYRNLNVTNPDEQIVTIVTQNEREDNRRINVKPNLRNAKGMEWSHNRELIFDGGNEYRKFETLSLSHSTMGIEEMTWDGSHYNAFPFTAEPRINYVYDEDANGAFYVRNSDNTENDITCDYVLVNYRLKTAQRHNGKIIIDGKWTTFDDKDKYTAHYDGNEGFYTLQLLQKQGYYSYQFLYCDANGKTSPLNSEGNFHETENSYQAYIYFKGQGERYWQLVGYKNI